MQLRSVEAIVTALNDLIMIKAKNIGLTACCLFLLGAIVAVVFAVKLRQNVSLEGLGKSAMSDIQRVGGAVAVCKEADKLFEKFGTDKLTVFSAEDLSACPAITKLGSVDGIWPGGPAYLKIRVGNHLDGYIVQVFVTNGPNSYVGPTGALISPRIYVHR